MKVSLRIAADESIYTARREEAFATSFKLVNGQIEYPKLTATGPVVGVFRDKDYSSQFNGVFEMEDIAGTMAQHIRGTITGTSVVAQITGERPTSSTNFATHCRILDEHPKGRYLVDGVVAFQDAAILVGPNATIENARDDKSPVVLTDSSGREFRIEVGKKVFLDSSGNLPITR